MSPISESVQAKMVCLRQVSYAQRDYALLAAKRLFEKSGRVVEPVPCGVCRGYHCVPVARQGAAPK